MKKYFLLLALLLIAALAAVGLHPEVLDGYKKDMYAKEINTSTGFFNEKIKTPVLAALKGGPDQGMQSGGLTPEELAAQENGDPDNPDKTGNGTSGITNGGTDGGTDEPGSKDPEGGTASNPDNNPDGTGTKPKGPSNGDPEPGTTDTPEKVAAPDKSGTDKTDGPDKTAGTDSGKPAKAGGDDPKPVAVGAGSDTPEKAPSGDAIKYVYDEFTAAGGVEFTGYSGLKSQNCWFNDVSGHFDMPNGSPAGGSLKVVLVTEELDCKDGVFTKVCRGNYLDVDNFPEATFTSTSIKASEGDNNYRVVGKLQIKDNTNLVGFDAVITQNEEEESATVSAEFKLDRQDYGLDYNGLGGGGGYAISDEFSLKLELTGETE